MTTAAPVTLTLEERVERLEEVLGELGHFSLLSVGGTTLKLTGAALAALDKLGETEQRRIRTALAADPRPWFSSADVARAREFRQTDIEGGKA